MAKPVINGVIISFNLHNNKHCFIAMLKVIFYCIAALPLPVTQFLGARLGSLLNLFDNRERRVARINIALCFSELSADKQADLVKQTLQENAKTLLEMPRIFRRGGHYAIGLVKSVLTNMPR